MFGIGKRKTKADLEREVATLRAQHQALVARTAYYQNLVVTMGNQVQQWMQMHEEVLKQLGAETPQLKAYADSVAQAIREAYPDPSALIATIAMTQPGTHGALTRSPTKERYLSPGEAALQLQPARCEPNPEDWQRGPLAGRDGVKKWVD